MWTASGAQRAPRAAAAATADPWASPHLHIPYDPELFTELNVERFELGASGKLLFNHPEGTNDDRFWALTLAVYETEQTPLPPSKPMVRIILFAKISSLRIFYINDKTKDICNVLRIW
jgi:hypothetical protein